jgi:tRNA 2-thiouridine synthesizing protein E
MKQKSVTFNGKIYTLDKDGFLYPSDQWDEKFAEGMATKLGISGGLTEKHWSFISYLRNKFIDEKSVPVVVIACKDNNLRLHEFKNLFPTGYHRGACKIAGINYEFMYKFNMWLTFETAPVLKNMYKMTPLGFLENFNDWDERFASLIASKWDLPEGLTDQHQTIIAYLREFYRNNKNIPTLIETCKANNISLDELGDLFPEGYRRGACRIAGLPFYS